uniref:interleukin-6 receptor subunit beta-like n=1 Tax=Pristiophorus japonicus TaxID=55135 RepID=UPI00398F15D6
MAANVCFSKLEVCFLLVHLIDAGAASVLWESCSHMTLSSPVLQLGNPLRATCRMKNEDCAFDYRVNPTDIVWRMNEEEISKNHCSALHDQVSTVIIPSFNQLKGNLTCYVRYNESLQLLQWAEVKAGFPPRKPRLLFCTSYWTSFSIQSIACNWDPGPDAYLETNFTLHISETIGKCNARYLEPRNCTTSRIKNSCMVLVSNLVSYHDIWVTAKNGLGTETSNHMCLDGMLIVKFNAPQIIEVKQNARQSDCLLGEWEMPMEMVKHSTAAFEIQYKALEEDRWIQVPLTPINSTFFRQCNLSPYTEYQLKIRCKQKTDMSPWSEWSNVKTGTTSECAPAQKLQVWRSIEALDPNGTRRVRLLWKPLKKNAANGKILGYRISLHEPEIQAYNTSNLDYSFHLLDGHYRIYVSAYNSVGESPKADIVIPSSNEIEFPSLSHLFASSNGNSSLLMQWEPPSMTTSGYVVEWCVVSEKIACNINWQSVPANKTKAIVQDNIEQMRLYKILVYPLFDGLPGLPASTQAYSKEGAPRCSPALRSKQIWKTKVQIEWDELPIDDRNGFIRNYTVLYTNKNGKLKSVVVNGKEYHCILAGLSANTEYEVTIMASTDAGSTIGSNLVITTKTIDDGEIEAFLMVIFSCSLLMALILIAACISQWHRIKKHFWPNIPDPANSTLAQWMPKQSWQDVKDLQGKQSPKAQVQVVDCRSLTKAISKSKYYWIHGNYPKSEFNTLNEANSSIRQSFQGFSSWQNSTQLQHYQNLHLAPEYRNVTINQYKKHENSASPIVPSDSTQPLLTCLSQMIPSEEYNRLSMFHRIPDNGHGNTLQESNGTVDEQELLHSFPLLMNLNVG